MEEKKAIFKLCFRMINENEIRSWRCWFFCFVLVWVSLHKREGSDVKMGEVQRERKNGIICYYNSFNYGLKIFTVEKKNYGPHTKYQLLII